MVDDAGLLVPAADVAGLAQAMQRLLSSESLRSELSERALRRARAFDWSRAARQTLDVYREVAA